MSARQRRVALSRMASKMGCKSCGELAMARSTSEMAVWLLDEFGHPILRLRSGPFSVNTLVHAEQFLGLDGGGSVTQFAIALTAVQTEDAAKHPTEAAQRRPGLSV
jgi:hypothetical protein